MTWLLLVASALGAELVVDAKVPVELYVSGRLVAQLAVPGELHLEVEAGPQHLKMFTDGNPRELDVTVDPDRPMRVVVGRTGITADGTAPVPVVAEGPRAVEFRSVATEELLLVVGDTRYKVAPGAQVDVELDPGDHAMSVRGAKGTVIYAEGTLHVGDAGLVVHLAEGRMPEVAGAGGAFRPNGGG